MLKGLWQAVVWPMLRRPSLFQVAALCYRKTPSGPEILMITSRDTGRWILPKGWPKKGFDAGGTVLEEAWEEAGVKPSGGPPQRIGHYRYYKRLKGGLPVTTDVDVYAIEIDKLYDRYPEVAERQRRWMTPQQAAEAVDEPDLKDLLRALPDDIAACGSRTLTHT